jgi:hypothetical protein
MSSFTLSKAVVFNLGYVYISGYAMTSSGESENSYINKNETQEPLVL